VQRDRGPVHDGWWQLISPPNLRMMLVPSACRYRLCRELFLCIVSSVYEFDSYFGCCGVIPGWSLLPKVHCHNAKACI
jgi:hypothetical protein